MSVKRNLENWTEIEPVLIIIGKTLGIYEESLTWDEIPNFVLFSRSEDNPEVEAIHDILQILLKLGAIQERDGERDDEFRWNPDFKIKWQSS